MRERERAGEGERGWTGYGGVTLIDSTVLEVVSWSLAGEARAGVKSRAGMSENAGAFHGTNHSVSRFVIIDPI